MYYIDKSKKPKDLSLFLATPNKNRTVTDKIKHVKDRRLTVNFGKINELTFSMPYDVVIRNKLVRNPSIDKIKEKYYIKAKFGDSVEWFLINKISKSSSGSDEVTVQCFSLGYQLRYKKVIDYVAKSLNLLQVATDCLKYTGWKVGYIHPDFNLKFRQFDVSSNNKLDFIYDIAETFEAVPIFDSVNKQVHFYKEEEISQYKGFWITYGKYINTIEEEINSDEIVTRLYVKGSENLSINSVNPTGQSYIDDFSYFMYPFEVDENGEVISSSNFMSDELCLSLLKYNSYVSSRKGEFNQLLEDKKSQQETLTEKENSLSELKNELQIILDSIQIAKKNGASTTTLVNNRNEKNTEIQGLERKIADLKIVIGNTDKSIETLKNDLNIENFLSETEHDELISNYVHMDEWIDENKIDENDLYDAGINRLSEINSPPVNIKASIINFFKMVTEQHNWDRLNIGDIIQIKHDKLGIWIKTKVDQLIFDFDNDSIDISISNSKKKESNADKIKRAFYTIGKINTDYSNRKIDWKQLANNFNLRNDRISEKPVNPKLTGLNHATNDNGSVNLNITWEYPDSNKTNKNEDNIDGFFIYLYQSQDETPYIFGSKMASETVIPVDATKRNFTFPSVPSNLFYTVGIKAYRSVDEDINSEGVLTSDIIGSKNPYLPSKVVNINGKVNGSKYSTTTVEPKNPDINDVWVNPSDGKTRIYTGSGWNVDTQIQEEIGRLENEIIPEVEQKIRDTYIPEQDTPPAEIGSGLWWDTSVDPPRLKRYDPSILDWVVLAPTEEEVNTQISDVMAEVGAKVDRDGLIQAINDSTEVKQISAGMLDVGGVVAFINNDTSIGTLISGERLITGSVTAEVLNVDQVFSNSAVIEKVQTDIVKTTELVAEQIVSGKLTSIEIEGVNISGGTFLSPVSDTEFTKITGGIIESRGIFTRTWNNETATHDIRILISKGYIRARNESKNRSLYFSDYGLSTTIDSNNSSGTLEFFSKVNSTTGAGVTLSSDGVTTVQANGGAIYLNPSTVVQCSTAIYAPSHVTTSTNGYFGVDGELRVVNKATADTTTSSNIIYRNVRAAQFLGFGFSTITTNAYIGSDDEVRMVNKGYIGGATENPTYRNVRAGGYFGSFLAGDVGYHVYVGTDSEFRVTSRSMASGGIIYRNARVSTLFTNAVDINEGTHLYLRPTAGGEVRATSTGSTSDYVDFRCKTIYRQEEVNTSNRDWKKNIVDYDEDALYLIDTTPIREYHLLQDLDTEKKRLGIIMQEAPADVVDIRGEGVGTYAMTAMSWKAIQQLHTKIKTLESEVADLRSQLGSTS